MWNRLDHYWSNVYRQDHRSGCLFKHFIGKYTSFNEISESRYWKVKTVIRVIYSGMGSFDHLKSTYDGTSEERFGPGEGRILTKIFQKFKYPRGCPGVCWWSFDLTSTLPGLVHDCSVKPPKMLFPLFTMVTVRPLLSHLEWKAATAKPSREARNRRRHIFPSWEGSQPFNTLRWSLFVRITDSSKCFGVLGFSSSSIP